MHTAKQRGVLLRQARENAGLTQKDAHQRAGISIKQISRLENGQADNLNHIATLCEVYGTHTLSILFSRADIAAAFTAGIPLSVTDWLRELTGKPWR